MANTLAKFPVVAAAAVMVLLLLDARPAAADEALPRLEQKAAVEAANAPPHLIFGTGRAVIPVALHLGHAGAVIDIAVGPRDVDALLDRVDALGAFAGDIIECFGTIDHDGAGSKALLGTVTSQYGATAGSSNCDSSLVPQIAVGVSILDHGVHEHVSSTAAVSDVATGTGDEVVVVSAQQEVPVFSAPLDVHGMGSSLEFNHWMTFTTADGEAGSACVHGMATQMLTTTVQYAPVRCEGVTP